MAYLFEYNIKRVTIEIGSFSVYPDTGKIAGYHQLILAFSLKERFE